MHIYIVFVIPHRGGRLYVAMGTIILLITERRRSEVPPSAQGVGLSTGRKLGLFFSSTYLFSFAEPPTFTGLPRTYVLLR
jgi:hypothetical protein